MYGVLLLSIEIKKCIQLNSGQDTEQAVIRKLCLNWKGTNPHCTTGLKILPYVHSSTE